MTESKAWDWTVVKGDGETHWTTPMSEAYYLAHRWLSQDKTEFLDLGTGLGRHAIFFARQGFKTSAIDLSEESIKRAGEWAAAENLTIDFTTGDMLKLPYADASFDCIVCRNVIGHQDTKGVMQAFSEIHRILKPDGEVFITVGSKSTWGWSQDWPQVDANTKLRDEEGPEYMVPHFYADEDLIPELCEGFKIVSMVHAQHYWPNPYPGSQYTPVEKTLGLTHGGWHFEILMKKIG